ncbi:hypothetical protein TL16_g07171 [Triparma laevis f. inornata]|uniref:Uncharacterized protein n=1 Tax=Triparma laevis f. inornata TaxID=1714386 RepID=A0A9W7ECX7_9STRA|nr:hypothetical protein TL16_g07171 [Triparma laevis f. inornata]
MACEFVDELLFADAGFELDLLVFHELKELSGAKAASREDVLECFPGSFVSVPFTNCPSRKFLRSRLNLERISLNRQRLVTVSLRRA